MHFILFALIAAAICFPINRYQTRTTIAIQVIVIAMILRFANNMVDSLARTNVIGVVLGAWAIVITAVFITIGVLIWKEV
jgi:lipopolysaccharide export LptBFGC system permease protein LptF